MSAGSPTGERPAVAAASDAGAWATAFGRGVGVLVVGHGTADPVGAGESREVAALVAAMLPGVPVELGFLEVIGPSIGESLLRLAARQCRRIVAAPLLLFTAGHAREDVPAAIREGASIAGVSVRQASALGCHGKIVALSRLRRRHAVASLPLVPWEQTALVMVGRGSSDPSAVSQLREFTEATLESAESAGEPRPGRVEMGFVAAARPTLAEAIASAAREEAGFGTAGDQAQGADPPPARRPDGPTVRRIERPEAVTLEAAVQPRPGNGTVAVSAAGPVPTIVIPRIAGARAVTRRIIVQPHLLFRGHVEEQVSAAVGDGRRARPEIEWVQVDRLGPDPLVAEAVVERAAKAAEGWQ